MNSDLSCIDHLVYAAPDLQQGVDTIEALLGVRAAPGGSHPQWGTANALLSLGEGVYLEIIGPDPDQPEYAGERVFAIDEIAEPRLTTWAAKGTQLDELASLELADSERIGQAFAGSRQRPDGETINWTLTDPRVRIADGLVPFFIDWQDTPHPSLNTPTGARLTAFRVEHPRPDGVIAMFETLGLQLEVTQGPEPANIATIQTANGEVELR